MSKLKSGEYRVRFTNSFFTRKSDFDTLTDEGLTQRLNNILHVFSANVFIGYNVPIEIPIQGTDLIYRHMIDFLLVDSDGNVVVVEVTDLSSLDLVKQKMRYWPHHYVPYSFLTDVFKKDIFVQFVDPVNFLKQEYSYTGNNLQEDLKELKSTVIGVSNSFYPKNLAACIICPMLGSCD